MYRFAPSPTGDMHIGNLRAAILNFVCARQSGRGFYVRIEDTDTARNQEGKDAEILDILAAFGIGYDQLYYQSKNLRFHQQFAMQLVREHKAFACFCTEEELEAKREAAKKAGVPYRYDNTCLELSDDEVLGNNKPFVIRIRQPQNTISFHDEIKGDLSFEPKDIDSFVIMRADKRPMYNFACAVDDMLQNTTDIIRGEDHVSNTPKQEHIRRSLGYDASIRYAHLPIILNDEGKKMSKRDNASSVKWLLDEGYLPEAIANYLLLLGNKTPCEIFTLDEAVEWFDLGHISHAPARFDIDKLRHLNREHIRRADDELLAARLGYKGADFGQIAKLYTEEASTLGEIKAKISAIMEPKNAPAEFADEYALIKSALAANSDFDDFAELKTYLMSSTNLKGKQLFMPLRHLLTGAAHGPELASLYPLIKAHIKEIMR
jgi:glutamyl-tRNA synthetase